MFSTTAYAGAPVYFTNEVDKKYRALIKHVREMLPSTERQLAYLPSFYPFSLLDVRPTKLNKKHLRDFSNFNFGVFGRALLNIDKKQLSNLPSIAICKEQKCKNDRIARIEQFLKDSAEEIKGISKSDSLLIVQQTTPNVYRINNTFFSPTQLITYYPSKHAGFAPSGNYKISTPEQSPDMMVLAQASQKLRSIMAKHNVAAITKAADNSINVIFGGLGDNHWGVVLYSKATTPNSGDYNHIGLEYDIVQKIIRPQLLLSNRLERVMTRLCQSEI